MPPKIHPLSHRILSMATGYGDLKTITQAKMICTVVARDGKRQLLWVGPNTRVEIQQVKPGNVEELKSGFVLIQLRMGVLA